MSNKKHSNVKTIQPQTQEAKVETVVEDTPVEDTVDTVKAEETVVEDTPETTNEVVEEVETEVAEETVDTEDETAVEIKPEVVEETPVPEPVVIPEIKKEEIKAEVKPEVTAEGNIYLKITSNTTENNFIKIKTRLDRIKPYLINAGLWSGTKDTDILVGPYKYEDEAMLDRKTLISKGLRATIIRA